MTAARAARLERVRAAMTAADVDVLLLSLGADLPWLTGYEAMALERLTCLVLPVDGRPTLVVPGLEAPRVPDPGGLFDLRPWAETEDPVALVAALAGPVGRVAVSDRAWAGALLALQAAMPEVVWSAASAVTGPLRAVKDEAEVAALRAAAQAADRVAARLQAGELALAGRTEAEVSAALGQALLEEGHDRVNFAIVGSGPNGASPHHEAGARRIGPGDVVVCDFGGSQAAGPGPGYCSDITRTVAVGDPGAEVADCYAVLVAAQEAAVAAVAPGVAAEDVDTAARSVIAEAGLADRFIHRTGHGIGIEAHEDPYLVAGNRTPLRPGHCFSVEPGLYLPGRFGMRLEDIVVVTADGGERLNLASRALVSLAV